MKNHHAHQIAYFSREFKTTDFSQLAPWQKTYIDRVWKYLVGQKSASKILVDVGTGSGYIALDAASKGLKKVIAVDLTPESIDQLTLLKRKHKLSNLELILAPAEKTQIKTNVADAVVANAILEHIPAEAQAIREWKRITKPGGRLLVTVPLKFSYMLPIFWPINYIHDKRIGHLRRYDLPDLRKKFGLRVISVHYSGHLFKLVGTFANMLLKSEKLSKWLEIFDRPFATWAYGGSNISVIFEK